MRYLIAWLLRVNRLHGSDERWTKISTFAKAFQGGFWPDEVSVPQISRWETAEVNVPYGAIRRYEQLLDLEPNSLVWVIDALNRYHTAAIGPSPLGRAVRVDDWPSLAWRIQELIERVRSDEVTTANDWDELTTYISAAPHLLIVPPAIWDDIAQRLLMETLVATGTRWLSRYESFTRLMGHPVGQHAAIAACAALTADRTNLIFVETICALEASRHPDAGGHIVSQLRQPTNEQAFYGALLSCVRKTRLDHFTPQQRHELTGIFQSILVDDPLRYEEVRTVAAQLFRQSGADAGASFEASLRRAARVDPAVGLVLTTGRLLEDQRAAIIVRRVVDRALAMRAHERGGYRDDVLTNLVTDLLFHPVLDARLYAGLLIGASPYAPLLAGSLKSELTGTKAALDDVHLARSIFGALRTFGGPAQRPMVERYVLQAPSAAVAEAASFAIGHIGGASSDAFWRSAVEHRTRSYEQRPTPTNLRALNNLVYALGIARNDALLQWLRTGAPSAAVRSAASWWVSLPRQVYGGAVH